MEHDRWYHLEKTGEQLTDNEIQEGWHWCVDWDLALVGPGMREFESCTCILPLTVDRG
jgi:hypothetical protein